MLLNIASHVRRKNANYRKILPPFPDLLPLIRKKGSIGDRRGPGFDHLKIWMSSDERGVCPRKPPDSLVFRMFLVKIDQPVENRIITLGFLPKICQPVPRLGLDLDRCKGHLILLCLTIPSM